MIHPLSPLYDKNSKVLILGSFPSVKTREYGFFYGHPQNRFWPVMEALFGATLSRDIEERKAFLRARKIALFDAIARCDIVGSSDASIKNVVPSDLESIAQVADIREVFCNGATSYRYYKKYHAQLLGIEGVKLPSTSPANARYRLDDLLREWAVILEVLES